MAKDKSMVDRISDVVKDIVKGAAAAANALEPGTNADIADERAENPRAAVATPVRATRMTRRAPAFRANKRVAKS
ncbi:hypothetical protein [Bradyrhizobium sp. 62]|uniref:hypothetical protein n=1 Tax=Bradyrhizobium sp. 62 TaxID=1043588 RepID=UPI001FF87DC8|nr:hypothetical protein [Bradyrhizobium sp. 62]MCK1368019.1 hypothetical protein [Bradyrhizobium sp. 62]